MFGSTMSHDHDAESHEDHIMASEEPFKLRSYQDEMLEKSIRRNVIVAMDTGSGKTHIAIARIDTELQNSPSGRLVWFLAPTVALCQQ